MLRSRGNRLPSERAARFPSRFIVPAAPAASLFLYLSRSIAPSASVSLSPSLSVASCIPRRPARPSGIEDLSLILLLFSSFARKGITQDERFPSSLGILSIVFIVCRFSSATTITSFPSFSSSRSPSRRYRCIRTHTRAYIYIHTHTNKYTPARTLFPRRTAPFFVPDRDSSPISFRSPVIN